MIQQPLIQDIIPPVTEEKRPSAKQLFFGQIRTKVTSLKHQVSVHAGKRLRRRVSRRHEEPRLIQDVHSRG